MSLRSEQWLLVAGGFHQNGAMDKLNAGLAGFLALQGHTVHLVSHFVEEELANHPCIVTHLVSRPANSVLLGEFGLNSKAQQVANSLKQKNASFRIVANGGNCDLADINWVHCVHRAWPCFDQGAPLWFKVKNRLSKRSAQNNEIRIVPQARVIIANSEQTRWNLVNLLGIDSKKVVTIYPAVDDRIGSVDLEESRLSKERLGLASDVPIVLFAGSLSHDHNKGFDVLFQAWRILSSKGNWNAHLIVAGAGRALQTWNRFTLRDGMQHCITFLGFCENLDQVMAAADLVLMPSRYEAYGLVAHEAICRRIPVLISSSAGIVERFPPQLDYMVLHNATDPQNIVRSLMDWYINREKWRDELQDLTNTLRTFDLMSMASQIVHTADVFV